MKTGLLFLVFIAIVFGLITMMSLLSPTQEEIIKNNVENTEIKSVNTDLINIIKHKYIDLMNAIIKKKKDQIKKICTLSFQKKITSKTKAEKILCIIQSNVLEVSSSKIKIEFISRGLNTEIFNNICEFILVNNNFLINDIA